MAKDRKIAKKTRFRPYQNWCSSCEKHSDHVRRQSAEYAVHPPRYQHRRKKKKPFAVIAVPLGTPRKYTPKSAWVYNRYERKSDAEKALKVLRRKRWPGKFYELRIVDTRK